MEYKINGDTITFYEGGKSIGGLIFNVSNKDDIDSEYNDSVDDFDYSVLRVFDDSKKIVNIEDVWINRANQGNNLFRKAFELGFNELQKKYSQFILRACSDNGFPEDKLVSIYSDFGFYEAQSTDEDGVIMTWVNRMNECDVVSPNGGLTFSDVAGMGDITFPSDGKPGSGDLPLPSGRVYKQIMPFDEFVKIPKKKKKKRKLEKHSDAEHSPNPPMYKYVDDFRDYVERTKLASE